MKWVAKGVTADVVCVQEHKVTADNMGYMWMMLHRQRCMKTSGGDPHKIITTGYVF